MTEDRPVETRKDPRENFFGCVRPRLESFSLFLAHGDVDRAQELCQETYLRLLREFERRPIDAVTHPKAFSARVMAHLWIDLSRAETSRRKHEVPVEIECPDDSEDKINRLDREAFYDFYRRELLARRMPFEMEELLNMANRLRPVLREPIRLWLQNKADDEIAEIMQKDIEVAKALREKAWSHFRYILRCEVERKNKRNRKYSAPIK